ncbi:MAG: catalase [Candidatus Thioglobus sp.]|nr:catalase [Candidatus Thioglobus sp.]
MQTILAGSEPLIEIGKYCNEPYECDFKSHCWAHIPQPSVFNLYQSRKKFELYQQGKISYRDLQNEPLNEMQKLQISGKEFIDKKVLKKFGILMSDRGIPANYRQMHGFSSHTFSFWNNKGERTWFKWHFKSNQGIKNLTNDEAAAACPFGAQEDLVNAIDKGDFPSWSAKLQLMSEAQAKNYHINPFDLTKIWPHADFPLIEVGRLELNRNVENYFAETEQACFSPGNLVPGIGASPDKMLQARLMAYPDAHRYRVGANANQLPVNAAKCPVNHYQKDGKMAGTCPVGGDNVQTSNVNFYPNNQINNGAPTPDATVAEPPMPIESDAWIARFDTVGDEDYFQQAGDLFRLMNESQKTQLTATIAQGLVHASKTSQAKMLQQFKNADADYGNRIKNIINKAT